MKTDVPRRLKEERGEGVEVSHFMTANSFEYPADRLLRDIFGSVPVRQPPRRKKAQPHLEPPGEIRRERFGKGLRRIARG